MNESESFQRLRMQHFEVDRVRSETQMNAN